MLKNNFWRHITCEIIVTLILASILGLIIDQFWLCNIISLLLLLVWYIFQLQRLSHWIWDQNQVYPSDSYGSINILFYGLHKQREQILHLRK